MYTKLLRRHKHNENEKSASPEMRIFPHLLLDRRSLLIRRRQKIHENPKKKKTHYQRRKKTNTLAVSETDIFTPVDSSLRDSKGAI